jgi:hypothetical protein
MLVVINFAKCLFGVGELEEFFLYP